MSVYDLTSHLTNNRSSWRCVFPSNQLHWYWQPKTKKQNTTYTCDTKDKQKNYTVVWYNFYHLQPGNGAGPILI